MNENVKKILKKYNDLAQEIIVNYDEKTSAYILARACLNLEFKTFIRDSFEYELKDSFYKNENRDMIKSLKENDFIPLVINFKHVSNIHDLFIKYWNRIGEIITELKKYVKELEEEEEEK